MSDIKMFMFAKNGFNRNIMGCKLRLKGFTKKAKKGFNRNIMGCKSGMLRKDP